MIQRNQVNQEYQLQQRLPQNNSNFFMLAFCKNLLLPHAVSHRFSNIDGCCMSAVRYCKMLNYTAHSLQGKDDAEFEIKMFTPPEDIWQTVSTKNCGGECFAAPGDIR